MEPKMGDKSICAMCGQEIEYIGPYWGHTGPLQQRHPATPKAPAAESKDYGSSDHPVTKAELDAQPNGAAGEAPAQPEWTKQLDSREWSQVLHAQVYARDHSGAGAPGHGQFLIIAKMADMLDGFVDQKNGAYTERDKCLVLIARLAQELGFKVGIGRHTGADWDDEWRNILFVDLPSGQVSWHIHNSEAQWFYFVGAYGGMWDGHTTDEKYRRVLEPGL